MTYAAWHDSAKHDPPYYPVIEAEIKLRDKMVMWRPNGLVIRNWQFVTA
jgi:hypothetical protein